MSDRINSLTIDSLRGAINQFELRFSSNTNLTIVYGENGTGKSTISDAFDLIGNGKIGSLENRGLNRTVDYWPSRGKTIEDIRVTLVSELGQCACRVPTRASVVHDPVDSKPVVNVLRRAQIRELVEAQPAKRYEAIRKFVEVPGIDACEMTLRTLIANCETEGEKLVDRSDQGEKAIRSLWEQAGSPHDSWREWLKIELTATDDQVDSQTLILGTIISSLESVVSMNQAVAAATAATELHSGRHREAEQASIEAREGKALSITGLVGVINAAIVYLGQTDSAETCPICEAPVEKSDLIVLLESRRQSFGEVQKAVTHLAAVATELKTASDKRQLASDLVKKALEEFALALTSSEKIPSLILPAQPDASLGSIEYASWLQEIPDQIISLGTMRDQIVAERVRRNVLRSSATTWASNDIKLQRLKKLKPRLSRARTILEDERRRFVDHTLSIISEDVGILYEAVHPHEGLERISLQLDPNRRTSLDLTSVSGGQSIPPPAYFSDSHLDTLGMCIFIALAKLEDASSSILVLDDILGSMDEPHVDRLIEMIRQQSPQFRHCVVTTHYRPWKEKLRWGWLTVGEHQFVELGPWSAETGVNLLNSASTHIETLRRVIGDDPDRCELAVGRAGVVLEALLDFLTLTYECKVPRKPNNRYTLGELLPAINRKLRNSLRVERFQHTGEDGSRVYDSVPLGPILEELDRIAQVRNTMGAHFSELSYVLLDRDAVEFSTLTLRLADLLVDSHGTWPRNKNSGSYWKSSHDLHRLHPLIQPA